MSSLKIRIQRILSIPPQWYLLFLKLRPFILKYLFLIVCILGIMWHAVYTNYVINRLQDDITNSIGIYADLINAALFKNMGVEYEKVLLQDVIKQFDIPIIITNTSWEPVVWKNISTGTFFGRKKIRQYDYRPETKEVIRKKIRKLRNKIEPRVLYTSDRRTKVGYLLFEYSSLITGLAWMPFLEGIFIIFFSAFVYFALQNIMVTERSNLWVGLAKETAHQLGTPISSLMGWVEYMRTIDEADEEIDPEIFIGQVQGICDDMQKDLFRLKKISNRFSQIGSKPTLKRGNIQEIIEESVKYFQTRLPMVGKRIEIKCSYAKAPKIPLNRDLIEWVLENLFKNAVDAIDKSEGLIEIKTEYIEVDDIVRIQHIDNGRGISWDNQKNIFSPGFTTKTRGWGLGLTLAKRIIEDYHKGRIYVAWSQSNKGTAFQIDLPVIMT